jgi:hypothetical protein
MHMAYWMYNGRIGTHMAYGTLNGRNMDGLGLIRQPVCIQEEIVFLSTFRVAPVLVHFHSQVVGHVTLCHMTMRTRLS